MSANHDTAASAIWQAPQFFTRLFCFSHGDSPGAFEKMPPFAAEGGGRRGVLRERPSFSPCRERQPFFPPSTYNLEPQSIGRIEPDRGTGYRYPFEKLGGMIHGYK